MLHDKRVREDIKQRFYIHINTETFIKNKEIFMTITVLGSITGHVVTEVHGRVRGNTNQTQTCRGGEGDKGGSAFFLVSIIC